MTGEEHRSLSGGVAAANDRDLLAVAQLGFERGGPVPDPATFKLCKSRRGGTAITRAARNDHRARSQRAAVFEPQLKLAIVPCPGAIERGRLGWYQQLCAELLRLDERTTG